MRRTWDLGPFNDGSVPTDNDLAHELMGISYAMARFGGSLIVAPKRVRFPDGTFATEGWLFRYDSGNVPAVDAEQPKETPEAEGELTADEIADHFPEAELEPAIAE